MIEQGRRIFRYDTFGDEAFWGEQLRLHQSIVGQKLGGVGPGRFATLEDVVNLYDKHFNLQLSAEQKRDPVEYLKSLW